MSQPRKRHPGLSSFMGKHEWPPYHQSGWWIVWKNVGEKKLRKNERPTNGLGPFDSLEATKVELEHRLASSDKAWATRARIVNVPTLPPLPPVEYH